MVMEPIFLEKFYLNLFCEPFYLKILRHRQSFILIGFVKLHSKPRKILSFQLSQESIIQGFVINISTETQVRGSQAEKTANIKTLVKVKSGAATGRTISLRTTQESLERQRDRGEPVTVGLVTIYIMYDLL